MRTLSKHIVRSVARGWVLVLLILLVLFSFTALVEEIDDVGQESYSIVDALAFVALTTPQRMLDLTAVSALLGTMLALGGLAKGHELEAMRAAGVSPRRIAGAALQSGALLVLGAALVAELVAPPLQRIAETRRALALSPTAALSTSKGFWFRDRDDFVRVGEVRFGRTPLDVDVYEFDGDGRLRTWLQARSADVGAAGQWVLEDVQRTTIDEHRFRTSHHDRLLWDTALGARQLGVLVLSPSSLSPSELLRYVRSLHQRGQSAESYELALWQKFAIPLATAVMILLAVPFAFGNLRSASAGSRVMLGGVVGIGVWLLEAITARLGLVAGAPAPLTVLAPLALLLAVAVVLLTRLR
jgi:lipopolysaccharide export system permease protein